MPTVPKYHTEIGEQAVQLLKKGMSIAALCDVLDISRTTFYRWLDKYPDFADDIDRGLQKSQAYWERRGEEGIFGELDSFSATGWIFTMKKRFDDYRDKVEDKKAEANEVLIDKILDKLVD